MAEPSPRSTTQTTLKGGDVDMGERAADWEQTARDMIAQGRGDDLEALIVQATVDEIESADALSALGVLAMLAELQSDWTTAVRHWQLMVSISQPIATKSQAHVAKNPLSRQLWTRYASDRLERARCTLAWQLDQQGARRARDEIIARLIETVPNQIALKSDDTLVKLVGKYVTDALGDDGMSPMLICKSAPVRIALCYDVAMGSDEDTEAFDLIEMCRALLSHDAAIELHLIVTNERFVVSTPELPAAFTPDYEAGFADGLRDALPKETGRRFFVHVFAGKGLEGAVQACASIITIAPDVISYGGGHSGVYSNASKIIRHCLYPYFPTALHDQSCDEIRDECYDGLLTDDLYADLCAAVSGSRNRSGGAADGTPSRQTLPEPYAPMVQESAI